MARRTKAEALATHDNILDCAESVFVRQGVSRTTLQHIAGAAGVTRGAIYWHFRDKADLFNAMLQRAKMPLESAMQILARPNREDPLGDLREYAMIVFCLMEDDPKARPVFEIATLKIEYVDEMTEVRTRRAEMTARWMAGAESKLRFARDNGRLILGVEPRDVALGLWALMDGLLRAWMVEPQSFSLSEKGDVIVSAYLGAIRRENGRSGVTPGGPALPAVDEPALRG